MQKWDKHPQIPVHVILTWLVFFTVYWKYVCFLLRNLMKNLNSLLEQMGNVSTAAIQMGGIFGVISKLPQQNQTKMDFGFTSAGDVKVHSFHARPVITDL